MNPHDHTRWLNESDDIDAIRQRQREQEARWNSPEDFDPVAAANQRILACSRWRLMRIRVPDGCRRRLVEALAAAGTREIGGILMAEHMDENLYTVRDLTIQSHGGTFARFVRVLKDIVQPLAVFFRQTNYQYRRFNYLGEWHSHPSFDLTPSSPDIATMRDIVNDPGVGANFAVLVIVRLGEHGTLEAAGTVFVPGGGMSAAEVIIEEQTA